MVECDLPKVETRVRFPSPAPRLVEYWSIFTTSLEPILSKIQVIE